MVTFNGETPPICITQLMKLDRPRETNNQASDSIATAQQEFQVSSLDRRLTIVVDSRDDYKGEQAQARPRIILVLLVEFIQLSGQVGRVVSAKRSCWSSCVGKAVALVKC